MDPNVPLKPDTVGHGFGIGCLAMVVGAIVCVVAGAAIGGIASSVFRTGLDSSGPAAMVVALLMMALATLPLVAPIVIAVRLRNQGRPQAAKGVFAALLTAFALGVLLVAGCFGLLMSSDFR